MNGRDTAAPHDDVIKWKHFPRYWPFVLGNHRSPLNSPHKGQWRGALLFSLICAWTNGWVNNRDGGDLRRHCAHYDVTVMTRCYNEPLWLWFRADSRLAPSPWETSLQSNAVSHWLGANLESDLWYRPITNMEMPAFHNPVDILH